jgi:hypothetical protein
MWYRPEEPLLNDVTNRTNYGIYALAAPSHQQELVVGMMNGIHSDISSRANVVGSISHCVVESVTGDTLMDPWYLRIGRRKGRE